jgi:hypothetical protein
MLLPPVKCISRLLISASKLNFYESDNLPLPLFAKEGYKTSLWQREVRRDFIKNVVTIMKLLIMYMYGFTETFYSKSFLFTTVMSI